jgi:FemAB-related protein (PEP-CTERM system-associated)
VQIVPYSEPWKEKWETYVETHPEATVFHTIAWKDSIETAFRFKPAYLLAEDGGVVRGILPLFWASNPIIGKTLISTPFGMYGGVCSDTEETRCALTEAACKLAREAQVQYLELRDRYAGTTGGFERKTLYVNFECELSPDEDAMFTELPRDTRYMIRKGQKRELRSETGIHLLDICYDIYAFSVHQLGTPVFPRRYFHILRDRFGDKLEVMVVWSGSQAIAAVLSFRFRNWIAPFYGGSVAEARPVAGNNFMYWELMKDAARRGIRYFDFGRSKLDTGAYAFKAQWSMRENPLPYRYYLVKKRSLPNYSPANPRFKVALEIWKHLPLTVSKLLGPQLVRLFP